jgi:hypothetical protein
MTRVIALMALVALGLSGGSFHEPFHAECRRRSMTVTERSDRNPPQPRLSRWRMKWPPRDLFTFKAVQATYRLDHLPDTGGPGHRRRVATLGSPPAGYLFSAAFVASAVSRAGGS